MELFPPGMIIDLQTLVGRRQQWCIKNYFTPNNISLLFPHIHLNKSEYLNPKIFLLHIIVTPNNEKIKGSDE